MMDGTLLPLDPVDVLNQHNAPFAVPGVDHTAPLERPRRTRRHEDPKAVPVSIEEQNSL
jgi:hypothetical protein